MKILAIESSCDETAAAILDDKGGQLAVIANVVASQISIHRKYGGVVPEVAAREHTLNILPVIQEVLAQAGISYSFPPLTKGRVRVGLDAIAVTAGPGLATSLIVGVETAKAMAYAWRLPLIGVNHIAGHIYSAFIGRKIKNSGPTRPNSGTQASQPIDFPAIILTVSGGHTMLVSMKKHLAFKTIGETRDDAAGEAFDKGAKLLNLGYPGGPAIAAAAAKKYTASKTAIVFPRPMIHDKNFDFSFSGLKTSLLYKLPKDKNWQNKVPEYAYEYQRAIVDVLIAKTIKAAQVYKAKTVILSGGVAANTTLRQTLTAAIAKELPHTAFCLPDLAYTTDNAAMIGAAGYFKFQAGQTIALDKLRANPNWEL